jgi:hypothetical protein
MSIQELLAVIPPPETPLEVGDMKRWAEIERRLGIVFPSDYYELVSRYGSGYFPGASDLHFYNPFSESYTGKIEIDFLGLQTTIRDLADSNEESEYEAYPHSPGLFPFGGNSNGYTFFWLVDKDDPPDKWRIVTSTHEGWFVDWHHKLQRTTLTITTFLAMHLQKQLGDLAEETFNDSIFFKPKTW